MSKIHEDERLFENLEGTQISRMFPRLSLILILLLVFFIASLFLPWIQTSLGFGVITALNPADRVQEIVAPVNGRVEKWYVHDGSVVQKGQKIADIVDIDPYALPRLQANVTAMKQRLDAIKSATVLAMSNFNRQKKLYASGLTSKKEFEQSEITYQKARAEQEYYNTELIRSEATLSRQTSQSIVAEQAGRVINTLASSDTRIVKAGTVLATFLPETNALAAELYISGNDVPLVHVGDAVRLVFDGWPSIQFSGWPSISIGTFAGVVRIVDYAASKNGMFRVLVEPDNSTPWPSRNFLRMGTTVQGMIQLNEVRFGYELWRQMNGFPVSINNKLAELKANHLKFTRVMTAKELQETKERSRY